MSTSVIFSWPHSGHRVQLAGSFTDWKPVDMVNTDENGWSLDMNLEPGQHEFKFVVDGNWQHDPDQPSDVNNVGTLNNVIRVAQSESEGDETPSDMSSSSDESEWEIVQTPEPLEKLPAKNPCMEVERKFMVPEDFKERLLDHDFRLVQEFAEVLVDEYYDSPQHHLLKMDYWLRQRNGDWELKYPVGPHHNIEGTTLYHETTSTEDIMAKIRPLLSSVNDNCTSTEDLNDLVKTGLLTQFADLETRRHCFQKDDVNIVVDYTDWGFRIGEIEIVLTDPSHIGKALDKIDKLAKELAFTDLDLVSLANKVCQGTSSS